MQLFQHFMKDPTKAARADGVCTTEKDEPHKEEKLNTYPQIVNSFVATYKTEDVLAEAQAGITEFKKPVYMPAGTYSEALKEKNITSWQFL